MVAPGSYEIRARAELPRADVALFGTYRVRVDRRDISSVELMLRPGASLQGRVTFDTLGAPTSRSFDGIRVRAPLTDGSSFGEALTGDVAADGGFQIRGLMPGTHVITVEGLEDPWVLKEILWRGQDITDVAIDVESKERLEDVRITLTDSASDVSGTVKDRSGRPVDQALVLIIPVSSQFWTRTSRRFGRLYTSGGGAYRLRGLPAGEYRAVAITGLSESDIYRKEILTDLVARGIPLSLEERQRRVLDLGLTSVSACSLASSR
jgi:hypothetical protein